MRTGIFTLICTTILLAGCSPGGTQRKTAGDFRLEQWEDGTTYYLHKRGYDDSSEGGSIIAGTVVSIGWSSRYIVAQRHSIYRGDPDGWMILTFRQAASAGHLQTCSCRCVTTRAGLLRVLSQRRGGARESPTA